MCRAAKGSGTCGLGCVLLAVVDLFLELLGLLLINKAQARQAVFEFKGVEEHTVLVVVPRVVNFLVPDNAAVARRDIHHLEPKGVADKIIAEHNGTLQAGVVPS